MDVDREIAARFVGTSAAFTVEGQRSPRDTAWIGAGFGGEWREVRVSLRVDLDLGFEGYVAYGIGLGLTLRY